MKQIINPEYIENFITNVLADIDESFNIKKLKYKLNLDTYSNKTSILEYIENEKSKNTYGVYNSNPIL